MEGLEVVMPLEVSQILLKWAPPGLFGAQFWSTEFVAFGANIVLCSLWFRSMAFHGFFTLAQGLSEAEVELLARAGASFLQF